MYTLAPEYIGLHDDVHDRAWRIFEISDKYGLPHLRNYAKTCLVHYWGNAWVTAKAEDEWDEKLVPPQDLDYMMPRLRECYSHEQEGVKEIRAQAVTRCAKWTHFLIDRESFTKMLEEIPEFGRDLMRCLASLLTVEEAKEKEAERRLNLRGGWDSGDI